jgi:hypothetical protein
MTHLIGVIATWLTSSSLTMSVILFTVFLVSDVKPVLGQCTFPLCPNTFPECCECQCKGNFDCCQDECYQRWGEEPISIATVLSSL